MSRETVVRSIAPPILVCSSARIVSLGMRRFPRISTPIRVDGEIWPAASPFKRTIDSTTHAVRWGVLLAMFNIYSTYRHWESITTKNGNPEERWNQMHYLRGHYLDHGRKTTGRNLSSRDWSVH